MLACSAILASAADCAHLSLAILPERFHFSDMEAALQANVLKHDRLCINLTTPPPLLQDLRQGTRGIGIV